jgi:hypothetical protein
MSAHPREAARCRGVVREPGGWAPLGEMARCERRRVTVSTGGRGVVSMIRMRIGLRVEIGIWDEIEMVHTKQRKKERME